MGHGESVSDNEKEGVDEVKSIWPLWIGRSAYYSGTEQRAAMTRVGAILKLLPRYGLKVESTFMKEELLVIGYKNDPVNLNLNRALTARQGLERMCRCRQVFMKWGTDRSLSNGCVRTGFKS